MEDYQSTAKNLIDELALELMMLEPKDVPGWEAIISHLDELAALSKNAAKTRFSDLAKDIKSIVEELVSDKLPSPQQGIKQIGDGVTLFQEILRDVDDIEVSSEKIGRFLHDRGLSDETPTDSYDTPVKDEGDDSRDNSLEKQIPDMSPDISKDKELIESFIMESLEHLSTIEVDVLTLEQEPDNISVINSIFRLFHTIKGVSGFLNLSDIGRLAHQTETLLDDARDEKIVVDETITDVILDAVDLMKAMIEHLGKSLDSDTIEPADFGLEAFLDRLRKLQAGEVEDEVPVESVSAPKEDGSDTGSILIEKGIVTEQEVAEALDKQAGPPPSDKKIGEILIQDKKVAARDVAGALRDQKSLRGTPPSAASVALTSFVKVDTQKLDNMVDMVGELVITEAMLRQGMSDLAAQNKKLYTDLAQLGRTTSEIQKISLSLRMVPIKQTFQKMIRLVRDLSKKSGKLVNLEMIGEETEIDRNMVDEIYDPLVHMVRNSMDHGIEDPEKRKVLGKPETGEVILKAYHRGGNIVIHVSDDGKGLDREKIVKRAIERNLISSGDDLSDQDIYGLILQPGFSTADKVTDVSGRGVGMDVVKRVLDNLRGNIEIHSVKDQGTTILMKLPLTLAIIDGIMMRAGNRDFIIPTVSVVEFLRPDRSAYSCVVNSGEMIKIRDSLYPLIRLHEHFGFDPGHENPWDAIVVVAESEGQRKCILVDELIGKQEVVIKSMGEQIKNVKGMAGGAILADGRVGLIIDVAGLFELSEK